jgi:hypothetical protein
MLDESGVVMEVGLVLNINVSYNSGAAIIRLLKIR